MRAITKILAGGIAIAALATAAPATAQYYPGYGNPGYGYGYGDPYGGNAIGQVLNQVLGGGYGNGYGNYGANSQVAVNQCAAAVQQRLSGGYGYNGYGYNGYQNGGGARVLGISRVEPRGNGGLTVRGVASSGRYGSAYGGQGQVDLTWRCKVDYRGFVSDVNIDRAQMNYGSNYGYAPNNNYDYSQYGYRRY
ncbi:hypothetical protein [Sphingomonas sp.]|uniref:hypothetical protein n=1 Tax=Sphingomonas sp. TaxID=28214 RepID=UPI0038AEEA79